jgi:hypothetical protein
LSADGEISDGISVISEDELDECHAGHQDSIDWHKEELQIGHQRKKSKRDNEKLPLTPPSTPLTVDDNSDKQIQTIGPTEIEPVAASPQPSPINFKKLLLFGGLATMILAILINNYQLNNLKNRGEFGFEQRITDLEIEKDMLRDELERLKETLQVEEATPLTPATPDHKRRPVVSKQRQQQQLNDQKIVWSGRENDPLVIPDSMNILPDFCTKTFSENDDLYDEYNQVLCEKIQRKIDERTRNTNNYKKFNKELNKLRWEAEGNAEIFVDIENDEKTTDPPKNLGKEDVKKSVTKEQYQNEEQLKKQSNDPKKRMTKEEYEQMNKEKNLQKKKYTDEERKNKKGDRNERSNIDGSGGARAHHEHKDKKRQYTVEEQNAYREMKEKERQQRDYKHKDRNDGHKDKTHQYTVEEQRAYREMKEKERQHSDHKHKDKSHQYTVEEQREYRGMKERQQSDHKHKDRNDDHDGHKDQKRQYTIEEQMAYREMKEKKKQQKEQKDGNDDHDGHKDMQRHRKNSEEDFRQSNEWYGKRMESR